MKQQEVNDMGESPLEKRINKSAQSRRVFAQEELILDIAEKIHDLLKINKVKKTEIAATLGKSPAYVTQVLNGSRNMTLRTISDVAFALNARVHVEFCDADRHEGWHLDEVQPMKVGRVMTVQQFTAANINGVTNKTIKITPRYAVTVNG